MAQEPISSLTANYAGIAVCTRRPRAWRQYASGRLTLRVGVLAIVSGHVGIVVAAGIVSCRGVN
ncbi:MAG: hypothetical protein U9Q68_10450 [Euryarchaeota archaeon]|nr:hypothetical protein [Euryarchaeota archaeon]